MTRYLVIANETVGGDDLVEEVRSRAGQGTAFHVVVPSLTEREYGDGTDTAAVAGGGPTATSFAAPSAGSPSTTSGTTDTPPGGKTGAGGESGLTPMNQAQLILEQVLDRLRRVTDEVTGEVGEPDPVEAARQAMMAADYDGIVLATPPAGASKIVAQDVPHSLERAVDVSVTTVHADPADPRAAE